MSTVYGNPIEVRAKPDGSFIISVRVNDNTIIIKSLERAAIERLYLELMRELGQRLEE